jgi:hypothetical protein
MSTTYDNIKRALSCGAYQRQDSSSGVAQPSVRFTLPQLDAYTAQAIADHEAANGSVPLRQGAPAQARGAVAIHLLAEKHTGMRVDYQGLLRQCRDGLRRDRANAEMLRQFTDHLTELGQRWYAGDVAVVDEILQLYCIEIEARKALESLATTPTEGSQDAQLKDAVQLSDAEISECAKNTVDETHIENIGFGNLRYFVRAIEATRSITASKGAA